MKLDRTSRTLLALMVVASLPAAQAEPKKPAAPQGQPAAGAVKEASHKGDKGEATILLQFGVTGLTKDNESKVKEGLTSLTTSRYVCESCMVDKAVAGKCPKCSGDLAMKKKPVLQGSSALPDQSSITVTVAPGNSLSYTDLESALAKNSIKIDPAKFPVSGKAELILRGGMADAVPTIQKALTDAKLFDNVKATFDAAKSEISVQVMAGASAPTRAKLASVIDGSGTKVHLADVIFGGASKG
jgi:hypothetical protein